MSTRRVLHPDAEPGDLLFAQYAVVFAKIAGLSEEFACLLYRVRGYDPHALTHALVSLAVLFDALFYLPSGRLDTGTVALCGLGATDVRVCGGGGGAGLLVAVHGGGEAEVVGGGVAFFETTLDLYHSLFEEDKLGLEALENLDRKGKCQFVI